MLNHSLKYFLKTIWLKIVAHISFVLDKWGLLDRMKQRNVIMLSQWLRVPGKKPVFKIDYLAYGFLQHPRELEKLLQFDSQGIPLGWRHAHPTSYNPLMVSYLALVSWNYFVKTGELQSKARFFELLGFLVETGVSENDSLRLPYHQSVPRFGLEAPWYSGLAHAVAISAFIRAYDMTGNTEYKRYSRQLCHTLTTSQEDGGFLESLTDGGTWIQEYPTNKVHQVLNGQLFCLISLYEYQMKIEVNPLVEKVLDDCEATLFDRLPKYLVGPYTRYAYRSPAFSNIEYQGLFVFLFLHLHQLSGKYIYKKLALRFYQYTDWSAFFSFYKIRRHQNRLPKIEETI